MVGLEYFCDEFFSKNFAIDLTLRILEPIFKIYLKIINYNYMSYPKYFYLLILYDE
jgi:hypothetical protein